MITTNLDRLQDITVDRVHRHEEDIHQMIHIQEEIEGHMKIETDPMTDLFTIEVDVRNHVKDARMTEIIDRRRELVDIHQKRNVDLQEDIVVEANATEAVQHHIQKDQSQENIKEKTRDGILPDVQVTTGKTEKNTEKIIIVRDQKVMMEDTDIEAHTQG